MLALTAWAALGPAMPEPPKGQGPEQPAPGTNTRLTRNISVNYNAEYIGRTKNNKIKNKLIRNNIYIYIGGIENIIQ